MISLHDVTKIYTSGKGRPVTAVRNVTLEVGRGEFVVVTGRSGSGKTTLLNLIGGLTRPTAGQVMIDGKDVWQATEREQALLRNRTVGFVFQFPSLLPSLTVLENVLLPATFWDGGKITDVRERALSLLEQVGLADKMAAYPRQLSAGQQQRVVIARALINQPQVLLADEPTSNLDEQTESEMMALFRKMHAHMGFTAVMVTHSSELVAYGTRAVRMALGEIEEVVPKREEQLLL